MKEIESKKENLFTSSARLSFQSYDKIILSKKDLTLLHLISSVISSGYFKEICFYNASFLSTKFISVIFESCNLKSTDICSIWAKDCRFKNSDFTHSTISDSTFVNCIFEHSSFLSVSLINCQFINCVFEQMPIDNSTVTLNRFISCKIKQTHFTESFYYQIFENCEFFHVDMSPDLLGYNFGFSKDIIYQVISNTDSQKIEAEFINNGLFINAAILHINLVQDFYDKAIIACIVAISKMIQCDVLIKADEIYFLRNLTSYLEQQHKIAPISIIKIWSELNDIINNNINNISINKALPYIREYTNTIYLNFQYFLECLQEKLNQLLNLNVNTEAELKIIYYDKPSSTLLPILNEISSIVGPNCLKPQLIRVEKGSFIEFHKIAKEIIPYLQTFFSILGVFIPIVIYHKQKTNIESADDKEQTQEQSVKEIEIKISSSSNSSILLLPNTTSITPLTNEMVANTMKIFENQNLERQAGFSGYNPQNIQSITIRFQ
ncbi:MAG: pentapeptide repeat-containing protein [Ruminococcus flavefaciens]|nr:pentapeptide repeat-containing protein [Ruminococcus flavefaciens]